MSRVGSLVRFVGPVAALYVMGCADGAGADLVAPHETVVPVQACTTNSAGIHPVAKCAAVTQRATPKAGVVQRV